LIEAGGEKSSSLSFLDKMKRKTAMPQVIPPLNRPPSFQGHHIFETLAALIFDLTIRKAYAPLYS
jgi:hypothetical protein